MFPIHILMGENDFCFDEESLPLLKDVYKDAREMFDFDYPFNEERNTSLEDKIYNNYKRTRICTSDIELFKEYLENKMNSCMNFYNQLYKSLELDFNPLTDFKITESLTENQLNETNVLDTSDTSSNFNDTISNQSISDARNSSSLSNFSNVNVNIEKVDNQNTEENKLSKISDTPQSSIDNLDNFLSSATKDNIDLTTTNNASEHTETTQNDVSTQSNRITSEDTSTSERETSSESGVIKNVNTEMIGNKTHTVTKEGKVSGKSYAELLTEYRNTIINIDALVIKELSDLFYNLY